VGHEWPNLGKSLGIFNPPPRTPPPSYCYRYLHLFILKKCTLQAQPQEAKEPADEQERERAAHADDLGRFAEPLLKVQILTLHPSPSAKWGPTAAPILPKES
jgi:hypothetical protein